jgi:predicted nuclease with RNAse H fold
VITAGVDFATESARTALAEIEWNDGRAAVTSLELGVDDARIVEASGAAAKLGIDCPLGWPDAFLDFVTSHHAGRAVRPAGVAGDRWRAFLAYRETDRAVQQATGLWPLSVAADRIGLTAMRAAGLLADLADAGRAVDRAGTGVVVEVYPAASLRVWGLLHRGYKRSVNIGVLAELVAALEAAAPWLDLGAHRELCLRSDDAFDAVIAALTSRAAALSLVTAPADDTMWQLARKEGWIALPTTELGELVASSPAPTPIDRVFPG